MIANKLSQGFDRLAPWYDYLGQLAFGDRLYESQVYFLKRLKVKKRILLIGGGTGKLLRELVRHYPGVQIDVVDISEKMLKLSREKIQIQKNVLRPMFIQADLISWEAKHHYDLIITPYVLDCLKQEELESVCLKLSGALEKGGAWLFVDFNIPDKNSALSFPSRVIIAGLYTFFNRACHLQVRRLPDFKKAFEKANLKLKKEKAWMGGLLRACVYSSSLM